MFTLCQRLLRKHTWFSVKVLVAFGLAMQLGTSVIINHSHKGSLECRLMLVGVVASVSAVCCEFYNIGEQVATTPPQNDAHVTAFPTRPVLVVDAEEFLSHSVNLLLIFLSTISQLLAHYERVDQRDAWAWLMSVMLVFSSLCAFLNLVVLQIAKLSKEQSPVGSTLLQFTTSAKPPASDEKRMSASEPPLFLEA